MNVLIPIVGRLIIDKAEAYGCQVGHSPKTWPWWKLFVIRAFRTNPNLPRVAGVHSFNVWLYTRNDASCTWVCYRNRKYLTKGEK